MGTILYQGHSSFRVITNSGLVFYIDPYDKASGYSEDFPADVILVTHQHFDHNCIDVVPKKHDCTIITNNEALTDGEYNSFEINDVLVEAVPAYNKNHPKDACVGYIMEFDGRKIYFTGDTGLIDEMSSLSDRGLDLVFVPTDGIFTMTLEEAKECTYRVNAAFSVPVHTSPQYSNDEDKLFDAETAGKFEGKDKIIVKPGENIGL